MLRLRLAAFGGAAMSEAVLSPEGDGSERSEAKVERPFLLFRAFALVTAGGRPAPVCLQLRVCEAETLSNPTARSSQGRLVAIS